MVIGVAAEHVEQHAGEQLPQRLFRLGETMTDDRCQLLVACIARHQFIEFEQRQGGNHGFARPPAGCLVAIEARGEQDVLSRHPPKLHGCHI